MCLNDRCLKTASRGQYWSLHKKNAILNYF